MTTVLLVDDHPIVRSGLRAVLTIDPTITVVGETSTGEEAVTMSHTLHPDVVLCDLQLGAGLNGIATTAALRALQPAPAVLILTTFDRDTDIVKAIEAGAAGYLLKDIDPGAIRDAIHTAAQGGTALTPDLTARMLATMRTPRPTLTRRETEVLTLLAQGATNKEIAAHLFVTEATVKSHLTHIFTKLGADTRSRAIHVAQQAGLI